LAMRCSGITRSGARCERFADGPNGLCWAHNPANAEKRRRLASKAGKAKPDRELAGIKQRLSDLADAVLEEDPEKRVDKGVAAVASQVLNVLLRAVSVELRVREQVEMIERLEILEGTLARNKENRWHG
jgi:hypothetical protein